MPIRTVSLEAVDEALLRDLIARELRESHTLDFKRELKLETPATLTRQGKTDFLVDVIAMANASGGVILYGAEEGTGDRRGQIVGLRGMELQPDQLGLSLSQLLSSSVDERLPAVELHAVKLDVGTYCYVVRVPASPLAPHMVSLAGSHRDRWFYLRGTMNNDPMDARQIKETALRSETAVERVQRRIEARTEANRTFAATLPLPSYQKEEQREESLVLLHLIPLYQFGAGADLADQAVADRLKEALGYGASYYGNLRWALEGLYNQYESDGVTRKHWVLQMRDGALEFGEVGFLDQSRSHIDPLVRTLDVFHLDTDVLRCLKQARALADAGWFSTPFVLSLRLLNIQGVYLSSYRNPAFGSNRAFPQRDLIVEPEVVTDWGSSLDVAARRIFNTVWQAFGYQRSQFYNPDGSRKEPQGAR